MTNQICLSLIGFVSLQISCCLGYLVSPSTNQLHVRPIDVNIL
jgi:hypothetical protein